MSVLTPLVKVQPESMIPGSTLASGGYPPFMAQVFVDQGDGWVLSGVGFKVNGYFFTAKHVISNAEKVRIQSVKGTQYLDATPENFYSSELAIDLAWLPLDNTTRIDFIKSGKLMERVRDGINAMCSNGRESSIGVVTNDTTAMGVVRYEGSTVSGFSGSPYYFGNTIFGMHIGNAGSNIGYSSSFMALAITNGIKFEDDYIIEQIKAGKRVDAAEWGMDDVVVYHNGKYYELDRDEYYEAVYYARDHRYGYMDDEDLVLRKTSKKYRNESRLTPETALPPSLRHVGAPGFSFIDTQPEDPTPVMQPELTPKAKAGSAPLNIPGQSLSGETNAPGTSARLSPIMEPRSQENLGDQPMTPLELIRALNESALKDMSRFTPIQLQEMLKNLTTTWNRVNRHAEKSQRQYRK
uniref:Serine protease n=1 Tax=Riboviria sp. TaxID=2585031 RepID=A0A8K1U475_9VIRU|nr:MAG: hypothetical protein 1 [Riboviria sp.]